MPKGDLERIFGALERAKIRYLVVGGVAVVLHGHPRLTADLDLVVQLEPGNIQSALRALTRLGYRPRLPVRLEDFADPLKRREWAKDKGMKVFSLWNPRAPLTDVDLFVEEPFPFDAAYRRSVLVSVGNTSIRVVAVKDLISMKKSAGRPHDLTDVAALQALRRSRRGKARE